MIAVKTRPVAGEGEPVPCYAKLRAEASPALLSGGSGSLLLGFHIDPIYRVHWNNAAGSLAFSVAGGKVSPREAKAAEVVVETDVDPREFFISVAGANPGESLHVTVEYFACHDEDGWCKAVRQQYEIVLERDPDAGRAKGARRGGRPGRDGGSAADRRGGEMALAVARIMEADKDGDGKISEAEAPARLADRFHQMDTDGDGFVDRSEIEERIRRRTAPGSDR